MREWTSVNDLRQRLQKEWDKGTLLAARLTGEKLFPFRIALRQPSPSELGMRYGEARDWIEALVHHSKTLKGRGYDLEWREVDHKQLGKNRLPVAAVFEKEDDALLFIGRQKEAQLFGRLCREILETFPELNLWLTRRPLAVLRYTLSWPRLLVVLKWLQSHTRPGIYIRQLEIEGVDTKFIEQHKKLLSELLDLVLPQSAIDGRAKGAGGFEERYGFLTKPGQIRFRLLDASLYIQGLSDLQIPVDDFARLDLPVTKVFITENDINGLSFPDLKKSIVIFGLGYGLDRLAKAGWLARTRIYYWGDIDTHGFAMLDQIRSYFPQTISFLMDTRTLLQHKSFWGTEPSPAGRDLKRLTVDESEVFEILSTNRLAPALRLEQERISYTYLNAALMKLDKSSTTAQTIS